MSGVTFNTKSVLNSAEIKADIEATTRQVQAPLDALILQDSNFFCPIKTGTLQKSAITNSRIGSGELMWRTPYARRLYYEYEKPAHQANPNACSKWFEAAKARWLEKWARFVNDRIKRS
ncbi:MAG: minor capsid protein [Bacteroidaceae bacterium]|nr:minor capsid protein [Bacteroidaceae bacterium]